MYKVPGGKLLRVRFVLEEEKIASIRFTGDFFLHPEESIEELEEKLRGVEFGEESVLPVMEEFFNTYECVGAEAKDFLVLLFGE